MRLDDIMTQIPSLEPTEKELEHSESLRNAWNEYLIIRKLVVPDQPINIDLDSTTSSPIMVTTRTTKILDPSQYHNMTRQEHSIESRLMWLGACLAIVISVLTGILVSVLGRSLIIAIILAGITFLVMLIINLDRVYTKYRDSLRKKYNVKFIFSD